MEVSSKFREINVNVAPDMQKRNVPILREPSPQPFDVMMAR
jgi:hypothetical protein